jgi:hypothetical protein
LVCIDCDPDYFLYICILYIVDMIGLVVCEQVFVLGRVASARYRIA